MRLIDADELLEFVEDRYEITWESDTYEGGIKDACSDIIEKIDNMPTIDQPHWIPVTERLPEEDYCSGYGRQYSMDVLMTVHNPVDDETIVEYGHTTDGRWFSCTTDGYIPDNWSVPAWMPLPEPFKENSDG